MAQQRGVTLNCTSSRYSAEEDSWRDNNDDPQAYSFAAVAFLLGAFIVAANGSVVAAVARGGPGLRSRATSLYVVSLACTDVLVGLYQFMLGALYLPRTAPYFHTHRALCVFVYAWAYCALVCSALHMSLIALDRLFFLTRPLAYRRLVTETTVKVTLGGTWLLGAAFGLSLVPLNTFDTRVGCSYYGVIPAGYRSYAGTFIYFFTAAVSIAVYASIAKLTHRHMKEISCQVQCAINLGPANLTHHGGTVASNMSVISPQSTECPSGAAPKRGGRKVPLKAFRLFATVFGVFSACWTPYFVAEFLSMARDINTTAHLSLLFLGFLNSAMNVFVYATFDRPLRHALRTLWCRCTCRGGAQSPGGAVGTARALATRSPTHTSA